MKAIGAASSHRHKAAPGRGMSYLCLLAGMAFFLAGCKSATKPEHAPMRAMFFLEATGEPSVAVELPVSGLELAVPLRPVITEYDIETVGVAACELGSCLEFQFRASAIRDIYRLTASQTGRRLILLVNGEALGAHRIAHPITDGVLRVYVEKPDTEIVLLARNLQLTSAALQPEMARK